MWRLLWFALVASVIVNVILTVKLGRQYEAATRGETNFVGRTINPIRLTEKNGTTAVVPYRDKLTLLYIFARGCGWCAKNMPNMVALGTQAGERYRFVPIAATLPELLIEYAQRNELNLPLYSYTGKEFEHVGTPTTLLITPNGKVLRQWSGAYTVANKGDIEKALGVKLPEAISFAEATK